MRILFSYGLVGRGGDAVQLLEMVQAFQNLGHEVVVVGPQPLLPYEFRTAAGRLRTMLRWFPWWAKDLLELGLNLRTLRLAKRVLRHGNFDFIFHRAGIYDFVGVWIARNIPLVVHLDAPFPIERTFQQTGYFQRIHKWAMHTLERCACLIVTMSEASKKYYIDLGLPPEKIIIIPNGISERLYQQGLQLARALPPFGQNSPWTIGFVGSLSRWHRVDLLLEALYVLRAPQVPQWRLKIVGFGEEYARLRVLARKLGMDACIEWLGPLPHEQAFQEIAQFDVAVLPSTLPTGAPIKLFEYAALARPTIAPDLPNLRAWFADDEMRFIKPEDPEALAAAILSLCKAPQEAQQMGLRAQGRVAEYTWEKILQRVLKAAQGVTER